MSLASAPFIAALLSVAAAVAPVDAPPDASAGACRAAAFPDTMFCVVHASIDGLRADAVARLGPSAAPNLWRLRIEGAFTENARTDVDYTVTLPNHACQLTGRPVLGADGHGVTFNTDDPRTLAEVHGSYVAGAFDVAHDRGLRTACFAGKTKFAIFDRSWNETNGAPDTVGADDGRDKIDLYLYSADSALLTAALLDAMAEDPCRYAFIHFGDPDAAGHAYGWESKPYFDAVMRVDGFVGEILDLLESDARFAGRSRLVVAVDHGGEGTDHSTATDPDNYAIPLYVWGAGVSAGADLYALNSPGRLDPQTDRPPYDASPQPIRNGEAGNVCLAALGLPSIPGSSIGSWQDLAVTPPDGVPAVSIACPADGAVSAYPGDVAVQALADGGAAGIARVEFFGDNLPLGFDETSPYETVWFDPPLGARRITARAVRGDGAAAAASVEVLVVSPTAVETGQIPPPARPLLFPNPSDGVSRLSFALAAGGDASLDLFDAAGRLVGPLWRGRLGSGRHELPVNARSIPPGLYLFRLSAGRETCGGKLMIVR